MPFAPGEQRGDEAVSARDALLAYLRQAGLSTQRAEANLDAFAHELAEQLRDERPQYNPDWKCWGDAADRIDPEAQRPAT